MSTVERLVAGGAGMLFVLLAIPITVLALIWGSLVWSPCVAAQVMPDTATRVHAQVWQSPIGQLDQRAYLLQTDSGTILLGTGTSRHAPAVKRAFEAVDAGPVKYLVLLEGHGEVRGGVRLWREDHAPIVLAHRSFAEFRRYMGRLHAFRQSRMKRQFALWTHGEERRADALADLAYADSVGNFLEPIEADSLVDSGEVLRLGDVTLSFIHAPGETPDQMIVWVPELEVAFTGHNVADRFKLSVPRGHPPRFALEWAGSLDRLLELDPRMVLAPGLVLSGRDEVRRHVTRLRDALLHVHDETVRGMNAGKDVYTLMAEIDLPDRAALPENYGTVRWAVRGIYETYGGWFDGTLSELFAERPAEAHTELVDMAGGRDAVIVRAESLLHAGEPVTALRLLEMVEATGERDEQLLRAKLEVIHALLEEEENFSVRGWLQYEEWSIEEILNAFHR